MWSSHPMAPVALAAAIAINSPGCGRPTADAPRLGRPSPTVVEFLGNPTITILRDADRVEVFRLASFREAKADGPKLDRFAITGTGKPLGKEFASKVAAVLLDENTYDFNSAKGCIFDPGVAFRLWKDKGSVDVILCFSCSELKVILHDEQGRPVRTETEDFDRARETLAGLAKVAFPDDKEIQSL